jgi:hypothetical protein
VFRRLNAKTHFLLQFSAEEAGTEWACQPDALVSWSSDAPPGRLNRLSSFAFFVP